jgi:prephenate dehydrogenase
MHQLIAKNDGAGLEKLFNKASKARQDLDAIE